MAVLAGKTALVTGASKGIGSATAIALAEAGADVAINYSRSDDAAAEVAEECRHHGVRVRLARADVADKGEVDRIVSETIDEFGHLDIVVSNAAYSDRELFYRASLEGFRRTIDVSMWGAFYLVRAAANHMVDRGKGGNIVVVSSPHANMAVPGSMAYNMAKAAIDHMARTAAVELCSHRIRVNVVHPGWIDTPGERKFFSDETIAEEGAKLPWGRLGHPEEIGRGIVFLCDPASAYITGSTLTIDGGIQLPFSQMYRLESAEAQREQLEK